MTVLKGTINFLVDYCQRHAHPVNAFLHIFGVPMAFYGFFKLLTGKFVPGFELVFAGYLLQYLGHRAQGNEVGEVNFDQIHLAAAPDTQTSRQHGSGGR